MKASEIQRIYSGLMGIKVKKLPIKMSFILSRNLKKMEEVVQDIENRRNDLLNTYGEKGEDGQLKVGENGEITVPVQNVPKFMTDMGEVLNANIEIALDKVSMADVEKCDQDGYDNLTVEEVGALECMLDEGDME